MRIKTKKLTKDEFAVIESVLTLFPTIYHDRAELQAYRLSLALSAPAADNTPVQGGRAISTAERYAEGCEKLDIMDNIISKVTQNLKKLTKADRLFVQTYYFKASKQGGDVFRRRRICGCMKSLAYCYTDVLSWREMSGKNDGLHKNAINYSKF